MFRVLFLLFIIVPIIEISVLIHVGEWLGAWPTIFVVIFTAWLGAKNVRQQGIATLNSVQNKMAHGEIPSDEIVTGLLLLVAGVLLVTPGFVTDVLGLLLLIPHIRSALVNIVKQHIILSNIAGRGDASPQNHDFYSNIGTQNSPPFDGGKSKASAHEGQTLEGEFERKE